jgi:hypothetical protein
MTQTLRIEDELDARHAVARAAFLNRDIQGYRSLFSPNLHYRQADGKVIGRPQLMQDVARQFCRRYRANWHFSREQLVIEQSEAIETLVQVITLELTAFLFIHRIWKISRHATYGWAKPTGTWTIGWVNVHSEHIRHARWRFGFSKRM